MDCCDTKFCVANWSEYPECLTDGTGKFVSARFPTDAVKQATGWTGDLQQTSMNFDDREVYLVIGGDGIEAIAKIAVVIED